MATILLDENIEGYAAHLIRGLFSADWSELSTALAVRVLTFDDAGLLRGAPDDEVWSFCQAERMFLVTDNRNQVGAGSLEATIRAQSTATTLPVFTISDVERLRTERSYNEALIAKLLEYLVDADNLLGTGRLYIP